MKINKVEIKPTRFLDLNFDLNKKSPLKIPTGIEGNVVRVNVTYKKGEYKQDVIDKIMEELKKKNPAKVFLGNVKAIGLDEERENEKLDIKMSRKELVERYIGMYAPKQLKNEIEKIVEEIK